MTSRYGKKCIQRPTKQPCLRDINKIITKSTGFKLYISREVSSEGLHLLYRRMCCLPRWPEGWKRAWPGFLETWLSLFHTMLPSYYLGIREGGTVWESGRVHTSVGRSQLSPKIAHWSRPLPTFEIRHFLWCLVPCFFKQGSGEFRLLCVEKIKSQSPNTVIPQLSNFRLG